MIEPTTINWHDDPLKDKPKDGKWIIIEYISKEKDETFGKPVQNAGYYSEVFDEYKVHEPIQMSTAAVVEEPIRWRYA